MRFDRLRAKGLGPFRDEIDVDFKSISGTLVAITGGNGEGKSTLLELLAGSLYRQCPTRGSLLSLATTRDAFLEVDVVNGAPHRLRHVVDGVSGKGESVVTDGAGRPQVDSGKMRAYDGWAAKHLPPPEVLYASTFAAQGSGGFLDLKPADRKGVLLRVLGIERLEALAEKAREHVRASKSDVAILDARIADEKARASDPTTVAEELTNLRTSHADDTSALVQAKADLESLLAVEAQAKEAARVREDIDARRSLVEGRLDAARGRLIDLRKRLGNNQDLLGQAEEIRAAKAKADELDERIRAVAEEGATARADAAAGARDRAAARDALADVTGRGQRASDRERRIQERLGDKATIDLAVAALPDLKSAVAGAEVLVEAIEETVRKATETTLSDATGRLLVLRGTLRTIGEGVEDPAGRAKAALERDDEVEMMARELPRRLEEDRRNLEIARRDLATKRRDLTAAEKTAARAAEISAASAELVEARAEVVRLAEEEKAARTRFDEADARARTLDTHAAGLGKSRQSLETERAALEPLLKLGDRLTQAETRIAELSPQAAAGEREIASIEAELAALPTPPEAIPAPNTTAAKALVDAIERQVRAAEAAIAVKEAEHSAARQSAKRLEVLAQERGKVDEDLADWTMLAADLGRDGLQALEIDAAGPELTELVNDLLRTCVGSRWTVSIEASRLSADGKKVLEGCEVRVVDTERGRDGTAESLSGGERVLVGEAVSLALSMLACRRSGIQGATLVRDESGAALDPKNARAYVAMLRRAAEIVGASHVLFVSHSPEVQDLADARIEVRAGKVQVAA